MKVLLSVCVVSYNHEKYIKECIDSILEQDMNFEYEILVGDDCSADNTISILQEYGEQVKIVQRTENIGLCANTYDLFLRAQGKYVFTIAGDDYLCYPHILRTHVEFLEKHPEYYMVTGWTYLLDTNSGEIREGKYFSEPLDYNLSDFLSGKGAIVAEGTMRNTYKEDSGWNGFLTDGARNNEEMKLWFYILYRGKVRIQPEQFYVYRYVNKPDEAYNYNSTHTLVEMFEDYYKDIQILIENYKDSYNFTPLIMHKANDFLIKCSNNVRDMLKILALMRAWDVIRLILYKIYLKAHNYEDPTCFSKIFINEKK